jgi:cytidylate kinase
MIYSVAVDGPGGAGKSTLAELAAEKLGIVYVDTGAMYRRVALYMTENDILPENEVAVTNRLSNIKIQISYLDKQQRIFLNNEDVTDKIRSEKVSMAASRVSRYPSVRNFLMDTQRNLAKHDSVIMDGRDIGTVVLPNADVKIFLTAQPKVRAERRYKELLTKGVKTDYDTVLSDIQKRDWQDSHRETAPLKQAADAILLDTTNMPQDVALNAMLNIIEEKIKEKSGD